jgi:hypothetical protein
MDGGRDPLKTLGGLYEKCSLKRENSDKVMNMFLKEGWHLPRTIRSQDGEREGTEDAGKRQELSQEIKSGR